MNKETYIEMKHRHEQEYNDFTTDAVYWAFGQKQFDELLEKLNMNLDKFKKEFANYYAGGFIRKSKIKESEQLSERHWHEMQARLKSDFDFAKSAFRYELGNYEYCYSYRLTEVFAALGVTTKQVNEHELLNKAFNEARKEYMDWAMDNC